MKKMNLIYLFAFVIIATSLTSCAPQGYESHESGFFSGLWHGFIAGFSLIGKLFGADIGVYAEHNTGLTYWLGFILGIVGLGGGGSAARR
jgi:hypothetical protein